MNNTELYRLMNWIKDQMLRTPFGDIEIKLRCHDGHAALIEKAVITREQLK